MASYKNKNNVKYEFDFIETKLLIQDCSCNVYEFRFIAYLPAF